MTKEFKFVIANNFCGHTLKNMYLIKNVVYPFELLDRTTVGSRSMSVDEFPLFSQEESKEVMKHYNDECLKRGHPREVLVFKDLPKTHKDMYSLKRRHRSITFGEGPSEFVRTPTKVARTSELIIPKDTMGPEVEHVRF